MSTENVQKFYEAIKNDAALAGELQSATKEFNCEVEKKALDLVVEFAQKKGYSFTAEDMKAYETEAKELSEEELEGVNAGASVCLVIGLGWGDTDRNRCRVIGCGLIG